MNLKYFRILNYNFRELEIFNYIYLGIFNNNQLENFLKIIKLFFKF